MGREPRGGSAGNRHPACLACMAAFLGLWLGGPVAASASADACPNARLRPGPSEHLPDCRAYEQVSPVEKGGADAVTIQPLFPAQASACVGEEACAVVYMNAASAFAGAQGNEIPDAYLAKRNLGGWQTLALTPPTPQPPANGAAKITYAFSVDLSQAVLRVPLQQLTEGAPVGVYNLFLRRPDGSYSLVTTTAPPPPPRPGCGACFEEQDVPAFAGASSAYDHVIFEANDSLVEGAPSEGVENLYETTAGLVHLVGVLPDGRVPPGGASAGGGLNVVQGHSGELDHAISADGSHVLFQAAADGGSPDPQQIGKTELYDRIGGSSTVEISTPARGAEPSRCETTAGLCHPGSARFWAASEDGSVVLFTSKAALTKASYTGSEKEPGESSEPAGNDLYRFDVGNGALTDLTPRTGSSEDPRGAEVLGVVGASSDGSYVYFVAKGHLATGAPSKQPNLYVWHGTFEGPATLKFIATLAGPSEEEAENIEASRAGPAFPYQSDVADWSPRPTESQAYVTPGGTHLAFMSVNRLTGYDNEDAVTHEADHEVFEYSAETGQLVCASCDASGSPPRGSAFIGANLTERVSTPFHQPRTLSDDGRRLFFSSPDPLVPGLSGGTVKVFERTDGGVAVISGMGAGSDDVFLDATASGNDVFFATREQLASSDTDELLDVYDARLDGGLPAPTPTAPACQGSSCQGPPSPSSPFPSPVSSLFAGPGDLPSPPPTPSPKPTRKQLLARALRRCSRLKQHKARAACVKTARRRYAPKVRREPSRSRVAAP
jgi:hypothetical protein